MKRSLLVFLRAIGLTLPSMASAVLIDRGVGMIYDTDYGITWLQDANHAQTGMTWNDAMNWADELEYGGHKDWRLPTALNPDGAGLTA